MPLMAGDANTVCLCWCVTQALCLYVKRKQAMLTETWPWHTPVLLFSAFALWRQLLHPVLGVHKVAIYHSCFFCVTCRRHILLHGEVRQATWYVVGPLASVYVAVPSFLCSGMTSMRPPGDWEEKPLFLCNKTAWFGYRALYLLYFDEVEEETKGTREKRGWMPFLNQHSFSKALAHELACDVTGAFHQSKG